MTKDEAKNVIETYLIDLTDGQKNNLINNILGGRRILCGRTAYLFCDDNSGCLITLSEISDLSSSQSISELIQTQASVIDYYNSVISKYSLKYYIATTMLNELEIKELIGKIYDWKSDIQSV